VGSYDGTIGETPVPLFAVANASGSTAELLKEAAANLPLTQLQQKLVERRQIELHRLNSR
jgi:hypothetical protein